MPAWKWILLKFSSKSHFMRLLATVIILVAAYQSLRYQKIEDTWLVLVGAVINHYFNHRESGVQQVDEDTDPDVKVKHTQVETEVTSSKTT